MGDKRVIKARRGLTAAGFVMDMAVTVENGSITAVTSGAGAFTLMSMADESVDITDLGDRTLLPGFLDIHTHGMAGHDVMGTDPAAPNTSDDLFEQIKAVSKAKARDGVTRFCPTTVTAGYDKTAAAISAIKKAENLTDGARSLGGFLEGPFISERYKGAHPAEHIKEIDIMTLKQYIDIGGGAITSVIIAPEKENAKEAIKLLRERGVNARMGHSAATYAQSRMAVDSGVNIAVHTYNAMSPFAHREAGMAGEILLDDRIYAEIICDGIHVAPEAIKVLYKCKGKDKILPVTDGMCAAGMPDGQYKLGELDVTVKDGVARTLDGALAGSTLTLIDAVRNMNKLAGVPIEEAVQMASENPARALGLFDKIGSIKAGKAADLIAVDNDFNLRLVMINGEIIINKGDF